MVAGGPALWLARDGERPVGTVGLWRADDQPAGEAHLIGMWVSGGERGSGVAEALVAALVEHARGEGVRRLTLDVARENLRARRFYARAGFVPTGQTGAMPWDPSCVELRMALDLG
ncbi:GNAT family N-acetyltransferase [Phycicoccus endophyticus]|nr:GNAT family N-acetyltransferase [Phycicoccus endophyticus]